MKVMPLGFPTAPENPEIPFQIGLFADHGLRNPAPPMVNHFSPTIREQASFYHSRLSQA